LSEARRNVPNERAISFEEEDRNRANGFEEFVQIDLMPCRGNGTRADLRCLQNTVDHLQLIVSPRQNLTQNIFCLR